MPVDPNALGLQQRLAPNVPPDAHLAIASSNNDPVQAGTAAQAIGGMAVATTAVNQLKQRSQEEQASIWANSDDAHRQLWSQAGYKPPGQGGQRGFFSRVAHDVLGAPSALLHQEERIPYVGDATKNVMHGAGDVVNALASGMRYTAHLYRAGELHDIQSGLPGARIPIIGNIENAVSGLVGGNIGAVGGAMGSNDSWANAWHDTEHGDRTFDPVRDRQIQAKADLAPDEVNLAKAVASNSQEYVQQYLQGLLNSGRYNSQQIADLTSKQQDPHFQDVVQQYKDAKLSFGRSLVPQWMWTHMHTEAEALSGIGDLAFSFADPYLVLGKVNKVARIAGATWGGFADLATKLSEGKRFGPYAADVAKYTSIGDSAGLAEAHPELNDVNTYLMKKAPQNEAEVRALAAQPLQGAAKKPMQDASNAYADALSSNQQLVDQFRPQAQPIPKAGPTVPLNMIPEEARGAFKELDIMKAKSADAVKDFIAQNAFGLHIIGGGAYTIEGLPAIPTLSAATRATQKFRTAGTDAIDFLKEVKVPTDASMAAKVVGTPIAKPLAAAGDFLKKATTLASQPQLFDLNAPEAFTPIWQFANIALPPQTRDRLVNAFAMANNEGARKEIWQQIGQQVLKAAGVPETNDIYKRFANDTATGLGNMRFTFDGKDMVSNGDGTAQAAGILFKHANSMAYMPGVKEIYANVQRGRLMQAMYALPNNPFMDYMMTRWKKFTLARPGFGVRISSEELANSMLRNGVMPTVKSMMARRVKEAEGTTATLGAFHDLNPIEHGVTVLARQLGKWTNSDTPATIQAKLLAHQTDAAAKYAGEKSAGVKRYVDIQNKYPEHFENPLAEPINAQHNLGRGYASNPHDGTDDVIDGVVEHKWQAPPKVKVKRTGKWVEFERGNPGANGAWMSQLDDIAGDAASRPVLENINASPEQLRNIVADNLEDPKYREAAQRMVRYNQTADHDVVGLDIPRRQAMLDWADHIIEHVQKLLPTDSVNEDVIRARGNAKFLETDAKTLNQREKELRTAADKGKFADNVIRPDLIQEHGDISKRETQLQKLKDALDGISKWHSDAGLRAQLGHSESEYLSGLVDKNWNNLPLDVRRMLKKEGREPGDIGDRLDELSNVQYRRSNIEDMYESAQNRELSDIASRRRVIEAGLGQASEASHREQFLKTMLDTGASPDMASLLRVPMEFRPEKTIGPELMHLPPGGKDGVLSEYADKLLTRMGGAVNVVSRHPQYTQGVEKADRQIQPIMDQIFGEGTAANQEVMSALVHKAGVRSVAPYVHRPEVRSQMNVLMGNLVPFQFAQEQFWKRWGNTFIHNPEAMRKAWLAHHALGASGIVTKDDQGNENFTYPLSGFAQKAVADTFNLIGVPAKLPIKSVFSGQLKMVAPGLDRTFAPSFGPGVSIPLNVLPHIFPELQPVVDKVLGPIASGRPYWEQVLPASLTRFVNAATANESITPSYANAMNRSIQDLAANHHLPVGGFDDNGNPLPMNADERQTLMRRVSNWTRIQFFMRAALGLEAPASPQLAIGNTKIGRQITMLSQLKGMNLSQAMQEMVKNNPDAVPYEVFMSQGAGDETLPATKAALDLMGGHADFFRAHPDASGFFLPLHSPNDKFNGQAYHEQLSFKLRQRRSPQQFLDELEYAQAAPDYFATRDAYQTRAQGLKGQALSDLTNRYDNWKATYLLQHPVFADKLQAATGVIKRQDTINQLRQALNDPRAPKTPQTEQIRDLMATYDGYKARMAKWAGLGSKMAIESRKQLTNSFYHWAQDNIAAPGASHALALDVYNRTIRPDLQPSDANAASAATDQPTGSVA